jgi:hypothetical protein
MFVVKDEIYANKKTFYLECLVQNIQCFEYWGGMNHFDVFLERRDLDVWYAWYLLNQYLNSRVV